MKSTYSKIPASLQPAYIILRILLLALKITEYGVYCIWVHFMLCLQEAALLFKIEMVLLKTRLLYHTYSEVTIHKIKSFDDMWCRQQSSSQLHTSLLPDTASNGTVNTQVVFADFMLLSGCLLLQRDWIVSENKINKMHYLIHFKDSKPVCLTFDSQYWRYRTNFVHYENPHRLDIDKSFNKCQQWWACSCLTVWSTQMTLSQWHVPLSQDMKYHNDYITHLSITMAPYHTQSSNLWHCVTTASYHTLSSQQINSTTTDHNATLSQ